MEDAGQLTYLRASVRECGFDKKIVQIPRDAGRLTGLLTGDAHPCQECTLLIQQGEIAKL